MKEQPHPEASANCTQQENQSLRRRVAALELSLRQQAGQVDHHSRESKWQLKQNLLLAKENKLLAQDLLEAREDNRRLGKKLAARQEEVIVLQEQLRIALLPRNSSNSSRPPSADLYKPARNTDNSLRQQSGKKTGGQPGHTGSTLLFNTRLPDADIVHSADFCTQCGNDLSLVNKEEEEVRQVVDIPVPRCTITNHITCKKVCSCGHVSHGTFPAGIKSRVSYGPGVEAVVVNLSARQYLPYGRLAALIDDQYGIAMSEGTVANILERFAVKARGVYNHIHAAVPKER